MSIKIICEKRCHKGKPDVSYAAVFCDFCDERIKDAGDGNVCWNNPLFSESGEKVADDAYYAARAEPFFYHKECSAHLFAVTPMPKAERESCRVRTRSGRVLQVEDWDSQMVDLGCFPLYLGRNLGMKISSEGDEDTADAILADLGL